MQDPGNSRTPSSRRQADQVRGPLADTAAFLRAFGLSGELVELRPARASGSREEDAVCVLGYN